MNHKSSIILSGAVWLIVGVVLLTVGLNLLVPQEGMHYPLLNTLSSLLGSLENAAIVVMAMALVIGHFKGRFVLGKTAHKSIARLKTLAAPIPFSKVYTPRYFVLLGVMMLLGMSIKFFGLAHDIRGLIDVAVGSALINGALVYFTCDKACP